MASDWQQGILSTLESTQIAFLSTQGEKSLETSMVPYAIFEGEILLHLSALAKHSKNIDVSPNIGLMICTPETKGESPLSLPRISFQGEMQKVHGNNLVEAKNAYLARVPDAESLFSFPDFTLYRLSINDIFWVGGFGKARKVSIDSWRSLLC